MHGIAFQTLIYNITIKIFCCFNQCRGHGRGQFHQCFTRSFYTRKSQMRKITVKSAVSFCIFVKAALKMLMKLTLGILSSFLHQNIFFWCVTATTAATVAATTTATAQTGEHVADDPSFHFGRSFGSILSAADPC